MEQQLAEMTGKLWALRFTLNKTDNIITRENEEVSKWQKTSVTNMIKIVSNVKESIKEQKFAEGETDEQAKTWGKETENQLAEADDKARELIATRIGAKIVHFVIKAPELVWNSELTYLSI